MTGHQTLSAATRDMVKDRLSQELERLSPCSGLCSLAAGADQIFAEALLASGNELVVLIPSEGYEDTFQSPFDLERYRLLLSRAVAIDRLGFNEPSEEAFFEAGKEVVRRSDVLLAVWDGAPAAGKGGTADVVDFARARGKEVVVIWPAGAARSDEAFTP